MARTNPFDAAASDIKFKAWPALNDGARQAAVGVTRRQRLELKPPLNDIFAGTTLQCKLARALAQARALDRKEFFETFEFFEQVRSTLRCSKTCKTCVEVAGGHGLLGVLLAVLESSRFDHVIVTDQRRPKSFDAILSVAESLAPWVRQSLRFVEIEFTAQTASALLPAGGAVVCVHGCKSLTDSVVRHAMAADAQSIAIMPCCYAHAEAAEAAPQALRKGLGVALAADVQRTYVLEAAGFEVSWRHIPSTITPMNRVLVARRRCAQMPMNVPAQARLVNESIKQDPALCDDNTSYTEVRGDVSTCEP